MRETPVHTKHRLPVYGAYALKNVTIADDKKDALILIPAKLCCAFFD